MVLTLSQLLDEANEVINLLASAGVRVHASSRLRSYVRAFEAALPFEYSRPPDETMRVCHRALAELHDFKEIATVLGAPPEVRGWRERVAEALGGGILRADEKRHIRARDTQFELAVAAMLRGKGCSVTLDEPDILAAVNGVTFAVAAKRPRSRRNLNNIIRDAGNQLLRAQTNGLLAFDTTVIVNPGDDHFVSDTPAQDEQLISTQAVDLAKYIMSVAVKRFGDTPVYGILSRVAMPIWEPRRRAPGLHHQWTTLFVSPEQAHDRTVIHQLFN